jgi:predicted AAA+ superfamily ATPase
MVYLPGVIPRPADLARLRTALGRSPVVALLGPRQCGKTTLARQFVSAGSVTYFDLEDPVSLARLAEPMTTLGALRGTVVIDEIQRRPDLFPALRVLADRRPRQARFLVLGSASAALLRQSSESLAGRLETIILGGLSLADVGPRALRRHWLRGGYPRAFLARSGAASVSWRRELIATYLERDVPQLGVSIPAPALLRFWTMLAHAHGNLWNAADPARSLGVSEPTVRRYLDLLSSLFLVRQLAPWHENLAKRQVKAPKVYVRDSGLLHQLLGVGTERELLRHPKSGASWEGYVLEEVLKALRPGEAYFWRTHNGAELDLLLFVGGKRIGVEIKRADAPQLTRSMHLAVHDLKLSRLVVVYPGTHRYRLAPKAFAVPAATLAEGGSALLSDR